MKRRPLGQRYIRELAFWRGIVHVQGKSDCEVETELVDLRHSKEAAWLDKHKQGV